MFYSEEIEALGPSQSYCSSFRACCTFTEVSEVKEHVQTQSIHLTDAIQDKNVHVTIRKSRELDRPRDSAGDHELALVTHSSDTLSTSLPLFHLRMASVAYYELYRGSR
ncbi:hypothetical protein ACN42_g50 [Penicillium freii]|uniref:Uncharacterized protein n=1 Tax=Penicillium freii TaxID=48697 RepID=A0A124GTP5_PENFR|nr:hypothetical protein ACN42_g50 [Penicillium freii]